MLDTPGRMLYKRTMTTRNTNPEEATMSLSRYDFAAIAGEYKAPDGHLPPGGRAICEAWAWAIVVHYLAPNADALGRLRDLSRRTCRDVYVESAVRADGFGKMSLRELKATDILGDWSHFQVSSPAAVVDVAAHLVAVGGEAPDPGGLTDDAVEIARKVRGVVRAVRDTVPADHVAERHDDDAHTEMMRRAGVL